MTSEDIHYTSPDGLSLYAKSYGAFDAPIAVLCIHGFTRNHKDFDPMIEALGERRRFISVDVRGRGRSARDATPANYAPTIYANDMKQLVEFLDLKKVCLVGTSMGGLVSLLLMPMIPDRVCGLVLNDVGPRVDPKGLARIVAYAAAPQPVADWEAAAAAVSNTQSTVFPAFSIEDWQAFAERTYARQADGRLLPDYDPAIAQQTGKVRAKFLLEFAAWRLFAKSKTVPLLVIRGEKSDVLAEKTARLMLKRHGNAVLASVPGVGHAPLLNEHEALAALDGFFDRI